jgi:ribosomal protein S27AE
VEPGKVFAPPHLNPYANLSTMLPYRPLTLDGEITAEVSYAGVSAGVEERPVEHHCQICPNCGNRLAGHRCKLLCMGCGYYMSCADYY